jgi:hypothetical protein
MLTELINKTIGWNGRMISGSKSGYRDRHPTNLAIFNSNICTEGGNKVWYGDIDLTVSKNDLLTISAESNEKLYVLYEMDARFENEEAPKLERAVAVFSPDGTVTLNPTVAQYYSL